MSNANNVGNSPVKLKSELAHPKSTTPADSNQNESYTEKKIEINQEPSSTAVAVRSFVDFEWSVPDFETFTCIKCNKTLVTKYERKRCDHCDDSICMWCATSEVYRCDICDNAYYFMHVENDECEMCGETVCAYCWAYHQEKEDFDDMIKFRSSGTKRTY